MRDLGVDLHSNSFTVAFRNGSGRVGVRSYKLERLSEFARVLKKTDRIAVEATGNTRYFVDKVSALVSEVVVVNPNRFEIIKSSVNKTDGNDAKTLALFLSKDMIPKARLKTEDSARLSSLVGTRDKLVKLRTTLINKIHNLLNSQGIKSKKEAYQSDKALGRVLGLELDEVLMFELGVLVEQIRNLSEGIKKLDKEIKERGQKLEGHKNLTSIKGIGDKSATILLSVIGDVNDFPDEGKLAAYFGIVPRVSNSNEVSHHGRITKRGSKLGRTTLVQCTLVAIKYSSYLRQFYNRIHQRRGTGKAIIATARKLLGIIYHTLKNNWVFEDFPNFVIANN
jgi:transposase